MTEALLPALYQWLPPEGVKILLVLFLSFLVGLEREEHKASTGFTFGGVRTFPLIGLIGYDRGAYRARRILEMSMFSIAPDNNITAHATAAEAKSIPDAEQFASAKELGRLAARWPAARLIEIWNKVPGQKPLKKFTDRKAAVRRLWEAIQSLNPATGAPATPVAPKEPLLMR